MNENLRKKGLLSVLALTVALSLATFFKDDQNEQVFNTPAASHPKLQHSMASLTAHKEEHGTRLFYPPTINIFSDIASAKPAPTVMNTVEKVEEPAIKTVEIHPPVVEPVTMPTPAPLPFKFIGKLYGDDEYIVFLNYNGKSIAVKLGEVLFEKYKIEEIKPPTMTLVNLTAGTTETISIGEP